MSFKGQLAIDAVTVFANTAEFAELATYYPADGVLRTIKAVVRRDQVEPQLVSRGGRSVPVVGLQVWIPRSADAGVTEIRPGLDGLDLPIRIGAEPKRCRISKVLSESDLGWLVEAQA